MNLSSEKLLSAVAVLTGMIKINKHAVITFGQLDKVTEINNQ